MPLVICVAAIAGGVWGPKLTAGTRAGDDPSDVQINNDLRQIAQLYSVVAANYAVPVNPSTAIYEGAIPGMLRELDPHSTFFDPAAFAQMRENEEGRYFGVGMLIEQRDEQVIVVQPFEGTPAYKAGLRPGDVIMDVDGKSTQGLGTDAVATMLKGPKGTTVHVSVQRVGHPDLLQFTLVRAEVQHNSVDSSFQLQPGVVYIHLTGFTETSADEMTKIVDDTAPNGNIKGMVLDLRDNPGGLLDQAVAIGDMFLAKGQVIVSHHGRRSPEEVLTASDGNGGHDYPLVILVNSMTASAAEIVSGAVQDHDRGLIVGQTTFGKGLVQTVFPLSDDTGLALTTAHYYTPSGRLIQRPYEGVPLYDYFFAHDQDVTPPADREVKMTDTGRTVYGGGGITPDVKLPPVVLDDFQQDLLDRSTFFDFADYFLSKHASEPKTWTPDDATIKEFEDFLDSEHVPYTQAEISTNSGWLKQQMQFSIFSSLYGLGYAQQVLMSYDPEVAKAVTLLPQAAALENHAREVLASRQASMH